MDFPCLNQWTSEKKHLSIEEILRKIEMKMALTKLDTCRAAEKPEANNQKLEVFLFFEQK